MSLLAGLSQQGDSIAAHNGDPAAHGSKARLYEARNFALANGFAVPTGNSVTCATSLSADGSLTKTYSFLNTLDPSFCRIVGGRSFRNFLSASALQIAGSTHSSGGNEFADCGGGIDENTDADVIELKVQPYSASSALRIAVTVDGKYQGTFTQDATTTAGTVIYMKFTHSGGRGMRRWKFTTSDGSILWLEVHVDPTMTVLKPAAALPKIFVLGDSVREGYNTTQPYVANAYVHHLGRLLNANLVNCSRTGTGYLEVGPAAGYRSFTQRWATEASFHADTDIYLFGSSVNDAAGVGAHGGYTEAQAVAAALALWQAARAQSPQALIVVESPVGYTVNANVISLSAALKAAFYLWADAGSKWIDLRSVITAANQATYCQDGAVHPNDTGASYLANHDAREIVGAGF